MSFRLTEAAKEDVGLIWDYIAANNPRAADRLIDDIYRCCDLLGSFRLVGQDRSDLVPGLRFIPVGVYLIFYFAVGQGIEVARVIHGARDYRADFF